MDSLFFHSNVKTSAKLALHMISVSSHPSVVRPDEDRTDPRDPAGASNRLVMRLLADLLGGVVRPGQVGGGHVRRVCLIRRQVGLVGGKRRVPLLAVAHKDVLRARRAREDTVTARAGEPCVSREERAAQLARPRDAFE